MSDGHFNPATDLPVPSSLDEAIHQRNHWCECAAQFHRNETWYRSLLEQIGELFGDEAKTSDDGSRHEDVLIAKVPELVGNLVFRMKGLEK